MNFLKALVKFLFSREFIFGLIDRLYILVIGIVLYITLIVSFLYKPAVLFYLILAGMFAMLVLMVYFIFPEFHERLRVIRARLINYIKNKKRKE